MPTLSAPFKSPEKRWAAVRSGDATADGCFVYAVRTTGVYCRPSCGARTPLRENVQFFNSVAAAEAAGFRPCKRCQPNKATKAQRDAALVAAACGYIESAETLPTHNALALVVETSPSHLREAFRKVTGLTPKEWICALRAARLREELDTDKAITHATFDAGYASSGRLYSEVDHVLGMTPRQWRDGGPRTTIRFAVGQCSFGEILVAATERGLCAVLLGEDSETLIRDLQDRFPHAELIGGDTAFEGVVATVIGFVEAPHLGLDLPFDLRGTAFQMRVWKALREVPAGATTTYTELAQRIGAPTAVRAVASACAANPLAVAIPCHRVLRLDGGLSGYRWGVERKRALIAHEAATINAQKNCTDPNET